MSIFDRFRHKANSASADKARLLVTAANTYAVSLLLSSLDEFPSLDNVDPKRWDTILTTAGVFVAVSRLNQETLSDQSRNTLLEIVRQEAVRLDPHAIDALDDCRGFVERTYDGLAREQGFAADNKFYFSDSLGGWIVWNLVEHAPTTEEERRMVRALGANVVHSFYSWWAG